MAHSIQAAIAYIDGIDALLIPIIMPNSLGKSSDVYLITG